MMKILDVPIPDGGATHKGTILPGGRCSCAVEDLAQSARFTGLDGDSIKAAFREITSTKSPVNSPNDWAHPIAPNDGLWVTLVSGNVIGAITS